LSRSTEAVAKRESSDELEFWAESPTKISEILKVTLFLINTIEDLLNKINKKII
jgi:hypothetical protein